MPAVPARSVAVIGGTGRLGRGLASRLAHAGVDVIIGSREEARARSAASALGFGKLSGLMNRHAARSAEVIVVTVPYDGHRSVLEAIANETVAKVVLDTTVPLTTTAPMRVVRPPAGSAAEEAQQMLPQARVVGGFHTVSGWMLADFSRDLHGDVLLCGDDVGAKEIIATLARAIGMRPVDVGPLAHAHALEQLGGLLLAMNEQYSRPDLGIRITGLDEPRRRDKGIRG